MIRQRKGVVTYDDRFFAGYDPVRKPKTPAEQQKEQLRKRIRKIKEERRIRSIKLARTIRTLLYFLLGIGSLTLIALATSFILRLGSLKSETASTWRLQPLPVTYSFKEFGVSSNSEFCSEMARTLYNEDYDTDQIAAAMAICLIHTEGFQHEQQGLGVAISAYMNTSECEESNHNTGALKSLLHKLGKKQFDELMQRLTKLEYYPVSYTVAELHRRKGTEMIIKGLITHKDVHTEGTILPMNINNKDNKDDQSRERWTDRDGPMTVHEMESEWEITNATKFKYYAAAVCGATPKCETSFVEALKLAILTSIRDYSDLRTPFLNMGRSVPGIFHDSAKDMGFYVLATNILRESLPLKFARCRGSQRDLSERLDDSTKRLILDMSSDRSHPRLASRRKFEQPYAANFFALFDRRTGKAISYSHTSKRYENYFESYFFGNDRRYRPLIVLGNSSSLVWAGPGSGMSVSMDLPRKAHALSAWLISNVPIINALTTPMLFPSHRGYFYVTEGFVMSFLARAVKVEWKFGRARHLDKQTSLWLKDTGSVIDIRRDEIFPIYFDHNGPQLMPNGV